MSIEDANARIRDLRGGYVPTASARENLDQPMDSRIRVTRPAPGKHKLELMADEVAASWVTIFDFKQQIGDSVVRMGGLGGVGTHDNHRFKGYSRKVMESTLRWMRSEGYDVVMLFGILSFYPRYGYAPIMPHQLFRMSVRDLPSPGAKPFRVVDFTPDMMPACLDLYHASNVGITGITRRDPRRFTHFRVSYWGTELPCKLFLDARGKLAGYVVYDSGNGTDLFQVHPSVSIIEVGFANSDVFPAMLNEIDAVAAAQRVEGISMVLPPRHGFIEYCASRGLSGDFLYRRDGGCMARLVNLESTLKKVAPTLASRMRRRGKLTLATNLGTVALEWNGAKCEVRSSKDRTQGVQMPQWALTQLLYGFPGSRSLHARGVIKCSASDLKLLEEMFPVDAAFFYYPERF